MGCVYNRNAYHRAGTAPQNRTGPPKDGTASPGDAASGAEAGGQMRAGLCCWLLLPAHQWMAGPHRARPGRRRDQISGISDRGSDPADHAAIPVPQSWPNGPPLFLPPNHHSFTQQMSMEDVHPGPGDGSGQGPSNEQSQSECTDFWTLLSASHCPWLKISTHKWPKPHPGQENSYSFSLISL